jgi:hypothetical protein
VSPTEPASAARKLAAGLAARTDIHGVRLMKSSAEIMRIPVSDPVLTYDITSEASVEYEPGGEAFVVRGTYRLSINTSSTSTADGEAESSAVTGEAGKGSLVAKIEFEHAALFLIDKGADNPPELEELNAYAVTTGQFALYPYVREYVSDITGRLGLPPLTLGVLRMSLTPAEAEPGSDKSPLMLDS